MVGQYLLDLTSKFGDPFPFHNVMPMNPFDKKDWQTTMRWANIFLVAHKTKQTNKKVMHDFVKFAKGVAEKPPHHSLKSLWNLREYFGILEERPRCKKCGLEIAKTSSLWGLDYFERVLLKQPKKYDYFFENYLLPEKWALYYIKIKSIGHTKTPR